MNMKLDNPYQVAKYDDEPIVTADGVKACRLGYMNWVWYSKGKKVGDLMTVQLERKFKEHILPMINTFTNEDAA